MRQPKPNPTAVDQALAEIRAKAIELREAFGAEGSARTLEWAATRLEAALHSDAEQLLSLREASLASGYSEDHLARLVRQARIPAHRPGGPRGRIYLREADLPIKPGRKHTPIADVHELASRLGIRGKEGRYGHP